MNNFFAKIYKACLCWLFLILQGSVMMFSQSYSTCVVDSALLHSGGDISALKPIAGFTPGLFLSERGFMGYGASTGSAGTLYSRGVPGNNTLLLLDGIPQRSSIFGHYFPDIYLTADLDRAEIIRGSASMMYGAGSMGGVVNMITHRLDTTGMENRVMAAYGMYNSQQYWYSNSYNTGKLSGYFSVNHNRSDGHRVSSSFSMSNVYMKTEYRLKDNYTISGGFSFADIYSVDPGKTAMLRMDNYADIFRSSVFLSVGHRHVYGTGELRIFGNFGNHKIDDGYYESDQINQRLFKSNEASVGVSLSESLRLFRGTIITFGYDFMSDNGKADYVPKENENIPVENLLNNKTVYDNGLYIMARQEVSDYLDITGGVRFIYNSIYGAQFTPYMGLSLRIMKDYIVKASISKGLRNPYLYELFMSAEQNPLLESERSLNSELSFSRYMFRSALFAEITVYHTDIWKIMERGWTERGRQIYINAGSYSNTGMDIRFDYRLSEDLRVAGNFNYNKTDESYIYFPKSSLFLSVLYNISCFRLGANMEKINNLIVNSATQTRKSYMKLNAKIECFITKGKYSIRPFVNWYNIAGMEYQTMDKYPMPGISVMGGVEVIF